MSYVPISRNKKLKVPKTIKNEANYLNHMDDLFAVKSAYALAENKKMTVDHKNEKIYTFPKNKKLNTPLNPQTPQQYQPIEKDNELEDVLKIPAESSELIVITKAKKLGAYIMAVTQKSPAKFRGIYTARLQNFCLDIIEALLSANFIRMDSPENKKRRENLQTNAIVKLKMLGYVAMIAQYSGSILLRQYKQISIQIGETINLAMAWKKSDDEKWKEKQTRF